MTAIPEAGDLIVVVDLDGRVYRGIATNVTPLGAEDYCGVSVDTIPDPDNEQLRPQL